VAEKTAIRLLMCLALPAFSARGEDRNVASLHQFNLLTQTMGKTRLMWHNRVRFFDGISDFYQFRTGPIVYYDWNERLQLLAGYYLLEQRSNGAFQTIQRPWAGAQFRIWKRDRASVDWRNLLERHAYSGPGDFTRFRSRAAVNLQPKAGWQPYASAEGLALQGHVVGRYAAGVNYATRQGHVIGFGYEFRQTVGGPGSHFIATLMQFQIKGPRRREKPGEAEAPQ
jgi:hypothetical protein